MTFSAFYQKSFAVYGMNIFRRHSSRTNDRRMCAGTSYKFRQCVGSIGYRRGENVTVIVDIEDTRIGRFC